MEEEEEKEKEGNVEEEEVDETDVPGTRGSGYVELGSVWVRLVELILDGSSSDVGAEKAGRKEGGLVEIGGVPHPHCWHRPASITALLCIRSSTVLVYPEMLRWDKGRMGSRRRGPLVAMGGDADCPRPPCIGGEGDVAEVGLTESVTVRITGRRQE